MAALKKHCGKAHFEPVKVNNGADAYCMKEDTRLEGPWEFGTKPVKRNNKQDWEQVWQAAAAGDLMKIDPKIRIGRYHQLKQIQKDHMKMPEAPADLRGIWITGPSGCGKSRYAFATWPTAYRKLANKWWDGYQS